MISKIQYIWTVPPSKLHKLLNVSLKKGTVKSIQFCQCIKIHWVNVGKSSLCGVFFLIIRTIIFPAEKNQQKSLRYVILIRQKDRRWLIGKWEVALELPEKIMQQRETGVLLGVSPGTSCMSHPIEGPSPQK